MNILLLYILRRRIVLNKNFRIGITNYVFIIFPGIVAYLYFFLFSDESFEAMLGKQLGKCVNWLL